MVLIFIASSIENGYGMLPRVNQFFLPLSQPKQVTLLGEPL
jgi:hypothetical protein